MSLGEGVKGSRQARLDVCLPFNSSSGGPIMLSTRLATDHAEIKQMIYDPKGLI
jgi:hypothetical protein